MVLCWFGHGDEPKLGDDYKATIGHQQAWCLKAMFDEKNSYLFGSSVLLVVGIPKKCRLQKFLVGIDGDPPTTFKRGMVNPDLW